MGSKGQKYLQNIKKLDSCAFFTMLTFAFNDTEAMMGKAADISSP
jgi:hypothetical protein